MNLWLIRAGKAWNAIKREGFFNGGKRALAALFALFRPVGEGDILFVTAGTGDSAHYRVHNHAEELKLKGFKVAISMQDNPRLVSFAKRFKVFIFHQPLFTPLIERTVAAIKENKGEIVYETDDLIFDAKYFKHMNYLGEINKLEKQQFKKGVGEEIIKDSYVEVCTTTTSPLAREIETLNKKVFIVRNKICQKEVALANKILKNKKEKNSQEIKIGYFSGTISHNKDFALSTPALTEILEKYKNVKLCLVGPLDVENELVEKFKNQIIQLPFVPRKKHFENITKVDINISPLEIGNIFCEAKSQLKWFEAGILKIPTVASATGPFREAINDGVDGFVAENTGEWISKLSRLIENKELRKEMGEKARKTVLKKWTTKNTDNQEYYEYLKSFIG